MIDQKRNKTEELCYLAAHGTSDRDLFLPPDPLTGDMGGIIRDELGLPSDHKITHVDRREFNAKVRVANAVAIQGELDKHWDRAEPEPKIDSKRAKEFGLLAAFYAGLMATPPPEISRPGDFFDSLGKSGVLSLVRAVGDDVLAHVRDVMEGNDDATTDVADAADADGMPDRTRYCECQPDGADWYNADGVCVDCGGRRRQR